MYQIMTIMIQPNEDFYPFLTTMEICLN